MFDNNYKKVQPWEVYNTDSSSSSRHQIRDTRRISFGQKPRNISNMKNKEENDSRPNNNNNTKLTKNYNNIYAKQTNANTNKLKKYFVLKKRNEFISKKFYQQSNLNSNSSSDLYTKSTSSNENIINIFENKKCNEISKNTQSVKHVIEKFNRLSRVSNVLPIRLKKEEIKQSNKEDAKQQQQEETAQQKNQELVPLYADFSQNTEKLSFPLQIEENFVEEQDNLITVFEKYPKHKYHRCSLKKPKLRSSLIQYKKPQNNLIESYESLINKSNDKSVEIVSKVIKRNSLKNVQLSPIESKVFATVDTQTTPITSATNILINVYNASPKNHIQYTPIELKISDNENNNFNFVVLTKDQETFIKTNNNRIESIKKKSIKTVDSITKTNVKDSIKTFEEHLKKRGIDDKNGDNIMSKIKSNYLLKDRQELKLSPRAQSVPF